MSTFLVTSTMSYVTTCVKFLLDSSTHPHTRTEVCVCVHSMEWHQQRITCASYQFLSGGRTETITPSLERKKLERSPVPLFLLCFRSHFMNSVTEVWEDLWPFSYTLYGWVWLIRPICIHSAWPAFNTFTARASFQLINIQSCCNRDSLLWAVLVLFRLYNLDKGTKIHFHQCLYALLIETERST